MESLDRHTRHRLLQFLPLHDLGRVAQTCRHFRDLCADDAIWAAAFERECVTELLPIACVVSELHEQQTWRWRCQHATGLPNLAAVSSVPDGLPQFYADDPERDPEPTDAPPPPSKRLTLYLRAGSVHHLQLVELVHEHVSIVGLGRKVRRSHILGVG